MISFLILTRTPHNVPEQYTYRVHLSGKLEVPSHEQRLMHRKWSPNPSARPGTAGSLATASSPCTRSRTPGETSAWSARRARKGRVMQQRRERRRKTMGEEQRWYAPAWLHPRRRLQCELLQADTACVATDMVEARQKQRDHHLARHAHAIEAHRDFGSSPVGRCGRCRRQS